MSIEDIPRWWPGLIGSSLFSFGGVSWIRINDDDPILIRDVIGLNIRTKYLGRGDFIGYGGDSDDGWGVIRGGDHDTARIVKARRV